MASEARTKPTTALGLFNVPGTLPASAENTASPVQRTLLSTCMYVRTISNFIGSWSNRTCSTWIARVNSNLIN